MKAITEQPSLAMVTVLGVAFMIFAIGLVSPAYATTLGSQVIFSTNQGDASFEIGHDNENDYPTGSVATNSGMYYTWVEDDTTNKRIYFSFTPVGTPETPNTPVEVDLLGTGNHTRTLYLFVDEPTVDIVATIDPQESIWHYRSTDSGATWGSPTNVVNGVTDPEVGGIFPMWADVEGDTITTVYRITSDNAPFNNPVYMHTSTDGGATFNPRVNILNDTNYVWEAPRVVIDGSDIHHAFINTDTNPAELVYYSSSDTGATLDQAFESGAVLSTNATERDVQTEIAVDGSDVSIFYIGYDTVDYSFAQVRSNNGGSTWTSHEEVFDDSTCDWSQSRTGEKVTDFDGSTIQVICAGLGEVDGFTARSTNMGTTWSSLTSFVNGDPLDTVGDDLSVEVKGNNVWVTWQKTDNAGGSPTGNFYTAHAYSDDGGLTFSTEQLLQTPSHDDPHLKASPDGQHVWAGYNGVPVNEVVYYYGATPISDSVPPVISAVGGEPINLIENQALGIFDNVQCIDDVDGTIVPNGNFATDGGVTIDTSVIGLQEQDYTCTDSATNTGLATIEYLINRQSSGGGGGSSSSSGSTVTSPLQDTTPKLEDIPPLLSFSDDAGQVRDDALRTGTSIADLFRNLFSERLDSTTGQTVSEEIRDLVPQRAEVVITDNAPAVVERSTAIQDFLTNFFANLFNR